MNAGRMPMRQVMAVLRRAIPDVGKWWPGESRFEILVGAVLTQNTTWVSVEKALDNLRVLGLLNPEALRDASQVVIGEAIRPSGYWRTKAEYLLAITDWFLAFDDSAQAMDDAELRASLLGVRGVGEETADDILLYAYGRGTFIYDAYGRRLLEAAGWGEYRTYKQARMACDSAIRSEGFSVEEYGLLHGLIVQAGKDARAAGGWGVYWPRIVGAGA